MTRSVIKLGGSLMHSRTLPEWLTVIGNAAEKGNIIIVPGGGEFADNIRDLQARLGFDDVLAHRLALLAMTQYGYFLQSLEPRITVTSEFPISDSTIGNQSPLIWLPMALIDDFSEIPPSWDYTSDSIALWLANQLNATRLILVKSIEDNGTDYIDQGFQELTDQYHGEIMTLAKDQLQQFRNIITS